MKSLLLILISATIPANAGILYSDLGTGSSVYNPSFFSSGVEGAGFGPEDIQARLFTVAGTGLFDVTQIDLAVLEQGLLSTFTASIWTDDSSGSFPVPGTELGSWNLTSTAAVNTCCSLVTQTGITGVTLMGGNQYFMVLGPQAAGDSSKVEWAANTQSVQNTSAVTSVNGGAWIQDGSNLQSAFDVLGTAAVGTPEPASLFLLTSGIAGLAAVRARKRR